MKLVSYEAWHQQIVGYLLKTQKYDDLSVISNLPNIGFLVFSDNDSPLACGFLRMVEGGYAQIDTLASNGAMDSETRHEAITMVVDALLKSAKDAEIKGIIAFTHDEGILKRAKELNFKQLPDTVIVLPLS